MTVVDCIISGDNLSYCSDKFNMFHFFVGCLDFLTSELEAAKMVASRPKATDGMGDKVIRARKLCTNGLYRF